MKRIVVLLILITQASYASNENVYTHINLKEVMIGRAPLIKVQLIDHSKAKVGAYLYDKPSLGSKKIGRIYYDFNKLSYFGSYQHDYKGEGELNESVDLKNRLQMLHKLRKPNQEGVNKKLIVIRGKEDKSLIPIKVEDFKGESLEKKGLIQFNLQKYSQHRFILEKAFVNKDGTWLKLLSPRNKVNAWFLSEGKFSNQFRTISDSTFQKSMSSRDYLMVINPSKSRIWGKKIQNVGFIPTKCKYLLRLLAVSENKFKFKLEGVELEYGADAYNGCFKKISGYNLDEYWVRAYEDSKYSDLNFVSLDKEKKKQNLVLDIELGELITGDKLNSYNSSIESFESLHAIGVITPQGRNYKHSGKALEIKRKDELENSQDEGV